MIVAEHTAQRSCIEVISSSLEKGLRLPVVMCEAKKEEAATKAVQMVFTRFGSSSYFTSRITLDCDLWR